MTTAYRTVLDLRKQGMWAQCVEGIRGGMRFDHFGVADVEAFLVGRGILWVQAYEFKDRKKHDHLNAEHPAIKAWLAAGGLFAHYVWHRPTKKLRKWTKEVRWIGRNPGDALSAEASPAAPSTPSETT